MILDHVALATRDVTGPLGILVGDLGGEILSGGQAVGFRPMQVFLGDEHSGMKIELLEPWDVERNDFLERFLTRHGDGAHHLTFKVDDLPSAIARVRALGYSPTGVDLSNPMWREAFLAPKEAHGTVVQLAESNAPYRTPLEEYAARGDHGPSGEPVWWPQGLARAEAHSFLRRVVLRSPVLEGTAAFYRDVLGGTVVDASADAVELTWPGGGGIRVEARAGVAPGVARLEVDGARPDRTLTVAGTPVVVSARS